VDAVTIRTTDGSNPALVREVAVRADTTVKRAVSDGEAPPEAPCCDSAALSARSYSVLFTRVDTFRSCK
jgi:hypothetical protein